MVVKFPRVFQIAKYFCFFFRKLNGDNLFPSRAIADIFNRNRKIFIKKLNIGIHLGWQFLVITYIIDRMHPSGKGFVNRLNMHAVHLEGNGILFFSVYPI